MFKCDACGKWITENDLLNGAIKSIPDQPETDNLCIECNKDNKHDTDTSKHDNRRNVTE